jgi:hypothetical protein
MLVSATCLNEPGPLSPAPTGFDVANRLRHAPPHRQLAEGDAVPLVGAARTMLHASPCDVRMRLRPCLRQACRQQYVGYFADAGSLTLTATMCFDAVK